MWGRGKENIIVVLQWFEMLVDKTTRIRILIKTKWHPNFNEFDQIKQWNELVFVVDSFTSNKLLFNKNERRTRQLEPKNEQTTQIKTNENKLQIIMRENHENAHKIHRHSFDFVFVLLFRSLFLDENASD